MNPKKLHILEQVARLYRRYGIKSVTMDDIAARLRISKKTIYEFFHDKEDLVWQVLLYEHDRRCDAIQAVVGQGLDAIAELLGIYQCIGKFLQDNNPSMEYDVRKYYPDIFQQIRERRRDRMYQSLLANLEKGIGEGLYRSGMDPGIIARLYISRIEHITESDLFSPEELVSGSLFREVLVYHFYGILSREGRSRFEPELDRIRFIFP